MKPLRATAISAALAAISLIILTTACVDSQQPAQSMPPRAEVSAPAPTNTPTPPEPTPTTAPEPTAMPEPTAAPASQSSQSAQSQPAPTAETTSTADANAPVPPANTPAPEPTAAPTNTPAPAPSGQTQAATGDAAAIFQSALTAMNALSSYRAEMEQVMMGIRTEVQADVIPPDSMGGDMTINLTGEQPIANSFIVIGDEAYITLPHLDNPQNQSWVQGDPSDIEATTSFLTWFETGSQYEFTPRELVGTEDLNGEETHRLRGSFVVTGLPTGMDQPDNVELDVWVGTSDSLIRKIDGAGEVEDIGLGEKLEIAISYSRFDDSAIQIERPTDFFAP